MYDAADCFRMDMKTHLFNQTFLKNIIIIFNYAWPISCIFNKIEQIAIQGTPQMAVDKEATCISLWRVYSSIGKRNHTKL